MSVSILIITRNEELDLPGCLASVAWSDDVHVFDSFSTDKTPIIAIESGAKLHQRVFDGYASQRNASLSQPCFKYPWVLILDADERMTEELSDEIRRFVSTAGAEFAAAGLLRRDYLFGRWLKHAQITAQYLRLVRPDRVRYEREVNEVLIPDGGVAQLKAYFRHYPFSKGLSHWIDKHNRYSSMEAHRALAESDAGMRFSWKKAFFASELQVRRFHQKGLFFKMPGRPLIKLFYMLFYRRAVLDGSAGVAYVALQCIYEYFIVIKQRELKCSREYVD